MEVLIKEGDYVNFLIEFEEGDFETSVTFNVYEVTSWNADNKEVSGTKHYLKGYIKWNGCSHIWFGDEDGYLHLCGKNYFERHKQVMDAIWDVCSKKIKGWKNETQHFGNVLLPAVLLNEIIKYIEDTEETIDAEWGSSRSVEELIEHNCMPELYAKLLALKNVR